MKDDKLITNYPFTFFESMSKILEATVGGTAGCIYSILFEAAGNCFGGFCEDDEVTPFMWLKALEVASKALKRYFDQTKKIKLLKIEENERKTIYCM